MARDEKYSKKDYQLTNLSVNKFDFSYVGNSIQFCSNESGELWFADSGATSHLTCQKEFFNTFTEVQPNQLIERGAGGISLSVYGKGDVMVETFVDGQEFDRVLKNVFYDPDLGINLFSVGVEAEEGSKENFQG